MSHALKEAAKLSNQFLISDQIRVCDRVISSSPTFSIVFVECHVEGIEGGGEEIPSALILFLNFNPNTFRNLIPVI